MANLRPSPAIVVPADLAVGDVVRKMRSHDVGSVLVVREIIPHDLVGIFTERDLLHRIDEIQHGGYWDKGIACVMTKPVISVSIYELKQAPEIMNRCHFRHLPVVYIDEKEQNHIVGVISMRDLFCNYFEAGVKTSLEIPHGRQPKIVLACKNPLSIGMLRTILSQGGKANIVEFDLEMVIDDVKRLLSSAKPDLLVVDLDFVAPARWARFLQEVSHDQTLPSCVVLFSPDLHDSKNTGILKKLSDAGRITAFAKPMDILSFIQKLQSSI